jgi:molybdopterin-guanine dinucleotide biosynthesis protein A
VSPPPLPGISGALLLGGASRRMGRDKARLAVGGVPMARRAAEVLLSLFDDVVAVDRPGRPARRWRAGVRAVRDPQGSPAAALTGIATALAAAHHPWVLVLACDMPFPAPALLTGLCRTALDLPEGALPKVVVPRTGQVLHPLCAVYHRGLLAEVRARLEAGDLKVQALARAHGEFVDEATLRVWDRSLAGLTNVNTPAELAQARARARHGARGKGGGEGTA